MSQRPVSLAQKDILRLVRSFKGLFGPLAIEAAMGAVVAIAGAAMAAYRQPSGCPRKQGAGPLRSVNRQAAILSHRSRRTGNRRIGSTHPSLATTMNDEANYICDSRGEEIVIPLDLTAGASQRYVEDCPVWCRPNVIHVETRDDGDVRVWAERE